MALPERWRGFEVSQAELLGPGSAARMTRLLELLTDRDASWLRANPSAPPLYRSGLRYVEDIEDPRWYSAPETLARGHLDCADAACWRAAELRVRGYQPQAHAFAVSFPLPPEKGGHGPDDVLFHILVRRGDGRVEDPSCALGMGNGCQVWDPPYGQATTTRSW